MIDENQDLHDLLNLAYFYLKFRPRTEWEIRKYLNKKTERRHWSRDLVEKAIEDLKERGLINDKEFIRLFVESRNIGKPKSVFVLTQELIRLGIKKELIDEYFVQKPQPEEELAMKALLPRWKRFSSMSKQARFQKASAFLYRRGFSYDIIKETIKALEEQYP
jgi:regulatory protein